MELNLRHTGARTPYNIAAAALAAAILAGYLTAVSPKLTFAAFAGLAAFALAFVLPVRVLLVGFVLITLSGFRPFPPILGFHVQGQYFLLIPLLLRATMTRDEESSGPRARWRPLVFAALLMIGSSIFAIGQDVFTAGVPVTTVVGDYLAWVTVFGFLAALIRLARAQGPAFARVLYFDLVDIVGLFGAFTVVTGILHFHSFTAASAARLSLADLNPNETGIVAAAAILLTLAPLTLGRFRARDLVWLTFLFPLLVLTGSRESLAATGIGLLVLLVHLRSARTVSWYLLGLSSALTAIFFVITNYSSVVPHSLLRSIYFPEITPYLNILGFHVPPALAERIYIQASGIHAFLQHPLFGIGFNGNLNIHEGMNSSDWWGAPIILHVAHDSFVTVAGQQGLLGLIPFLFLIFTALRSAKAAVHETAAVGANYDIAVGIRCTLILLVFGSFNIDALYADFKATTLFFWLIVTAVLLQRRTQAAEVQPVEEAEVTPPAERPVLLAQASNG